jgi:hypothetical protein
MPVHTREGRISPRISECYERPERAMTRRNAAPSLTGSYRSGQPDRRIPYSSGTGAGERYEVTGVISHAEKSSRSRHA